MHLLTSLRLLSQKSWAVVWKYGCGIRGAKGEITAIALKSLKALSTPSTWLTIVPSRRRKDISVHSPAFRIYSQITLSEAAPSTSSPNGLSSGAGYRKMPMYGSFPVVLLYRSSVVELSVYPPDPQS
jgi:hypothetical protein